MTDNGLTALIERIRGFTHLDRGQWPQAASGDCTLDDAIGQIYKEFAAMADRLNQAVTRQNLLESMVDNSTDAIISKTLQGIVTSWNPAAEEIFGYPAAEMIGQSILKLIPEDRRAEEREILAKISRGERIKFYRTVRRRKNGELFPVSVTISPILDENGTVIGASNIARDITEWMQALESLERADERYDLVLKGTNLGVWDLDVPNKQVLWSARVHALFADLAPEEEGSYDAYIARVHPEDRRRVLDEMRAHLHGDSSFDVEYRLRVNADQYAWVHVTGQAVWDQDGKPLRVAGSIEDISERKKLENDLLNTVEKLQKTNKDLDEFAYAASHDLKAPLRVINNASQWLMDDLEPYLTPETRENMALLRSRVKRMEKLLDDVLEYSRIGRTEDERFAELVKGSELLDNIITLLCLKAGFTVTPDAAFAAMTVARMPLQQVLMNLIGNALKHHDKPRGTVRVSMADAGTMVAFTVADDGPGMAEQFHDKVFEMFRTLKPRDQVEGSGMGLAMVRKNVEMMGGAISVQSSPGRGCEFRFTWPKSQLGPARSP